MSGQTLSALAPSTDPLKLATATNPKEARGIRKTPLHLLYSPAVLALDAEVMRLGAEKYGPHNWGSSEIAASTYYSAGLRHRFLWWTGEDLDPESGYHHLAHARCCDGLLLDQLLSGRLVDDRPKGIASFADAVRLAPVVRS